MLRPNERTHTHKHLAGLQVAVHHAHRVQVPEAPPHVPEEGGEGGEGEGPVLLQGVAQGPPAHQLPHHPHVARGLAPLHQEGDGWVCQALGYGHLLSKRLKKRRKTVLVFKKQSLLATRFFFFFVARKLPLLERRPMVRLWCYLELKGLIYLRLITTAQIIGFHGNKNYLARIIQIPMLISYVVGNKVSHFLWVLLHAIELHSALPPALVHGPTSRQRHELPVQQVLLH